MIYPRVDTERKAGKTKSNEPMVNGTTKSDNCRREHDANEQDSCSQLVKRVKYVLTLALEESNWINAKSKSRQAVISERAAVRGASGLSLTTDLMITGRNSSDMCCAVFCIDTSRQPRIEGSFDRALAACADIDYIARLRVVIVNSKNGLATNASRQLLSKYERLFGSNGNDIRVLDWDPKNICDLTQQILVELQGMHPNRKGIKDIDDTMRSLAQKHPNLFGHYLTHVSQETQVLELLQQIKNRDPYLTYGKILSRVFETIGIYDRGTASELNRVSDKKIEQLLVRYLGSKSKKRQWPAMRPWPLSSGLFRPTEPCICLS
jgi:hypothetical protein